MEIDNPTWVPAAKALYYRLPKVFRWLLLLAGAAALLVFGGDSWMYLLCIVIVNVVPYKLEMWTAGRDRIARASDTPTRGWGVDPSRPLLDRLRVDREIEQRRNAVDDGNVTS